MSLVAAIPLIGAAVQTLLNLIPDPNVRIKAEAEFHQQILAGVAEEGRGNRAVNQVEAAHSSIFVAGWRPAFGWIGVAAVAYQFLLRPFLVWGVLVWYPGSPIPPALDAYLWELVFGMLGIGSLRTFEKVRGVSK